MGIGEISSCAVCKSKISRWAKQEHTKQNSLVVRKRIDRGEGKDLPIKIPPKIPKRKRCRLCMNESHDQGHKETKKNMN